MSKDFITPDAAELSEAGLVDGSAAAADSASSEHAAGQWSADFNQRWQAILQMAPGEVLRRVDDEFGQKPGRARDILSLLLAQQLGYRRVFRRADTLKHKPLWAILSEDAFRELDGSARLAVEYVAQSSRPGRPAFHPMAALATLTLWRHGDIDQQRLAVDLLGRLALPDEPDWLYKLVTTWAKTAGHQVPREGRELLDLADLQLQARFWEPAALVGGFYLVRRFAPSWVGSPMSNLVKACDRAADQQPHQMAGWLNLIADAAIGGHLTSAWIEKPMRAAIRLSIDHPDRQQRLRDWHQRRPYDVDHARLNTLFEGLLDAYASSDDGSRRQACRALVDEVDQTAVHNPVRAQKLLELMVLRDHPQRVGSLARRLGGALAELADQPRLSVPDRKLIELYVGNYNIEPHAVATVRRVADRIDWTSSEVTADAETLDMYLVVSDYERAFEQLTCKFDGVILEHADKDAAARVKYFVEKRIDPNRLTRVVGGLFTPLEWLGESIAHFNVISTVVERGLQVFQRRIQQVDMSARVVSEYREQGAPVDAFEDIGAVNVSQVDALLQNRRVMRLVLSAVAGGLSGGLAPFSWAGLSLADAPVLLGLTADICSRFCWYYGFDPRRNPDVPLEILAVALGGSQAAAIEPMLLRQNLREYAVRKSLMVGAVAHGGVTQLAGRTLGKVIEDKIGQQASRQATSLAKGAVVKNMRRRAAKTVPSKTLPIIGAVLGASLNVALIYDVCEAAEAVLTDRFLERKYPDWVRKFDVEGHAEPDFPVD